VGGKGGSLRDATTGGKRTRDKLEEGGGEDFRNGTVESKLKSTRRKSIIAKLCITSQYGRLQEVEGKPRKKKES